MRKNKKSLPALIVPSAAPVLPLLVNRFPNTLALYLPNNILRSPSFCSPASFLIVSLTSFINKPDSPSDVTIFIISLISSFEIINIVLPDPNIFLKITASVVDAAAVNSNGIPLILMRIILLMQLINEAQFLNSFLLAHRFFIGALYFILSCSVWNCYSFCNKYICLAIIT